MLHDLNLAARFADLVILMSNGTAIAVGSPQEIFQAHTLSNLYATPNHVEHHERLDRHMVVT